MIDLARGRLHQWRIVPFLSSLRTALAFGLLGALFYACQTAASVYVPDAAGRDAISAVGMTCSSPAQLDQDCSSWSGATREIEIETVRMKVAGSRDGRTVLIAGPDASADMLKGSHGQVTRVAYEVAKRRLSESGIKIVNVTPVASVGVLYGYLIMTDTDSYSILKAPSVE